MGINIIRRDLALVVVLLVALLSMLAVFLPPALVVLDKILPALMWVLGSCFQKER